MDQLKISAGLEGKKKSVAELAEKMKNSRTVLVASTRSLPSSQFQEIKKNLRGKAEIKVAKKSVMEKAISQTEKGALQNLKEYLGADIALFFSDIDAFELSALLSDNQTPAKAKAGDTAPEDIKIEPGPTDLVPGPAISELSGAGLKVAVEGGKLAIKQGATIVKKGEEIDSKLASVLGKLNVLPMKVGFLSVAAYDANSGKVYSGIRIDREATLEELREMIGKAIGFSMSVGYINEKTIGFFISKAGIEEKALEKILSEKSAGSDGESGKKAEEKTEGEKKEEEKPAEGEEKKEGKPDEKKEDQSQQKTKSDKEEA